MLCLSVSISSFLMLRKPEQYMGDGGNPERKYGEVSFKWIYNYCQLVSDLINFTLLQIILKRTNYEVTKDRLTFFFVVYLAVFKQKISAYILKILNYRKHILRSRTQV